MRRHLYLTLMVGFGGILWCIWPPRATALAGDLADQAAAPAAAATANSSQAGPVLAERGGRPASEDLLLAEAEKFYRAGDFDHAVQDYERVLQASPNTPEAYAGLTRVYLKKKDIPQAEATIRKGVRLADSPAVRVALGELYFRQGKIPEAEDEWIRVVNSGSPDARAYFGLSRVRRAASMYQSSRNMLVKAHQLDPSDPEIRLRWAETLSQAERINFLEEYLAGETNDDDETRTSMRQYLDYLKARAQDPRGGCHLVNDVVTTETPLVRLLSAPRYIRGFGLSVMVNGKKSNLLLDTGGHGFLINRNLAEKAHVVRLADADIRGVGDRGAKSGYRGLVDSLKIGELEFQNCAVHVLDQRTVTGEDGLIGADVFAAFLVDMDFPNEKLRLGELPARPGENRKTLSLHTERDDASAYEGEHGKSADQTTPAATAPPHRPDLHDRYIAPEMASYTPVYRFGNALLVPTSVGEAPRKLFLLDTGSTSNIISTGAAEEVTKVHTDLHSLVQGLSGSVKSVYMADKTVMQFGHLLQENQGLVAFDLKHLSDSTGTEVSGILGFATLHMLDIKIDYRDGLVDFSYDPKRWGR